MELQKIYNVRVKIIPLVLGSLGAIPKQFGNRLKQIGVTAEIGQVQNSFVKNGEDIKKGSRNLRLLVVA